MRHPRGFESWLHGKRQHGNPYTHSSVNVRTGAPDSPLFHHSGRDNNSDPAMGCCRHGARVFSTRSVFTRYPRLQRATHATCGTLSNAQQRVDELASADQCRSCSQWLEIRYQAPAGETIEGETISSANLFEKPVKCLCASISLFVRGDGAPGSSLAT